MAKEARRQSPYVKYGKKPFSYQHKNCKHSASVMQSIPPTHDREGWRGLICASCNIIVRKFGAEEVRARVVA